VEDGYDTDHLEWKWGQCHDTCKVPSTATHTAQHKAVAITRVKDKNFGKIRVQGTQDRPKIRLQYVTCPKCKGGAKLLRGQEPLELS
jgi:hypothetical protein